ncbi:phosphatidylserine decarboxylase family protein [Fulvivirga sedimenti]|uniref:Phosphatidylserine decarboxylase proenzyme n=1 Tax=Fulvivirga sedimenti TaxID=2879465 RepID=A0A9X1HVR0_9BACT|nr:phosphatidylserine decarboxylase family protein [Fulvivirga sedimenti]MCA6078250.1 phosphatidylserine decarboxylase family protein [Fulvivirga sedimenti]
MTIHKEGRVLLAVLIIILVGINGAVYYFTNPESGWFTISVIASLIVFVLILQFFRSPARPVSDNDIQVIAPADGKVVVIEKTIEEEYLKDERIQLSIFMSPVNVHVNRMPVSGMVEFFRYHAGKYLVAWHPKSSTENERTTMVVKTAGGQKLLVRQIAGAVARRIKWYVKEGSRLRQGEEFGFIKFGSRVDVFLPLNAKINVEVGQKTKGGVTVLAELPGKSNES